VKNRNLILVLASLIVFFNLNAQTLVKDINTADASSDPKEFLTIGTKTYFSANDGKTGNELWVTDGTDAGTKLVKDIMTGDIPSGISNLTNLNGSALFWYSVNGNFGVYKSDGTATGTVRVSNPDTLFSFYSYYREPTFTVWGNSAYFITNGFLWKTDGTAVGTVKLLKGTSFGGVNSSQLAEFNGKLYFVGSATGGDGLWQTDGTVAGTKLVKKMNLNVRENFKRPVVFKNKLYFIASTVETGAEIWTSDGTDAGTVLVKDVYNDIPSNDKDGSFALHSSANFLFFVGRSSNGLKLWKSDGTTQGTVPLSSFFLNFTSDFRAYNNESENQIRGFEFKNKFYFFARGLNYFQALYESDGTELGTKYVHDVYGNVLIERSQFAYLVTDSLIFYNSSSNGFGDLAATNGTPLGNRVIKQITKETGISARATFFAKAGNSVLFSARYKNIGQELWKTNGTEAGTVLLKNINLKSEGSFGHSSIKFGNNVIFLAYDDNDGLEAWKTDGTTSGTQKITSTYTGVGSYFDTDPRTKFYELNNKLYFMLYDSINGRELRYFDNTLSKINLLKDINLENINEQIGPLTPFKNKFIFYARNKANGREPWISDGTEGGTQMISDLTPGTSNTLFRTNFYEYNGEMYFITNNLNVDYEVRFWKTDGTAAGTKNIGNATIDSSYSGTFTNNLVNIGGRLIFPGDYTKDATPWLWVFDGTTTKQLTRLTTNSYVYGDYDHAFKVHNNVLYFTKQDSYLRSSIWKTDGTVEGTKQISTEKLFDIPYFKSYKNALYYFAKDTLGSVSLWKINDNSTITLIKNIGSIQQSDLTTVEWDSRLYFTGNDDNGAELWSSDGTTAGTKMAIDINKGVASSYPYNFAVLNNTLLFMADDGTTGSELYKISSTGVVEAVKADFKIMLYPNPSQDVLNIKNEDLEDFKAVKLYNLQGELLKTGVFNGKEASINVQNLPPATYLLELSNDKQRAVKKFIKVK
jgi:trimeric autotransporter adhesin